MVTVLLSSVAPAAALPGPFSFNFSRNVGAGSVLVFGYYFPSITSGALILYWKSQAVLSLRFDYYPSPKPFGSLYVKVVTCAVKSYKDYYRIAKTIWDIYGAIQDMKKMIQSVLDYVKALYLMKQFWAAINAAWQNALNTLTRNLGTLQGYLTSFAEAIASGSFSRAWGIFPNLLYATVGVGIACVGIVEIASMVGLVAIA